MLGKYEALLILSEDFRNERKISHFIEKTFTVIS
jgi:hypothetical protein